MIQPRKSEGVLRVQGHPHAVAIPTTRQARTTLAVILAVSVVRPPLHPQRACRSTVKPADFGDLAALADRLLRFEDHYNATARPFDWRFSSSDLAAMLARLDAHWPQEERPLAA